MSNPPTEEDLGIAMTPEEQAILDAPIAQAPEDDVRPDDEGDDDSLVQGKPDPEAKTARERAADGKFVKAEGPGDGSKPDVVKPDGAKPEGNKPPPGYTDVRALQEARAENKVLMERMTALLEAQNRREARQSKAEQDAAAPQIPDKVTDPLGYIEYMDQRVAKIEGETAAQAKARQEAESEQAETDRALSIARPQFEEAAKADPMVRQQYGALLNSYAKELVTLHKDRPEFKANPRAFLGREMAKLESGHIKYALSINQPIPAYMKALAESRGITPEFLAWQASQKASADGAQQQQSTQQQRPIAQRQAAQARHMSMSDLPGTAAPNSISAKDLAKMSPKEFKAFADKFGDSGLDELMGKM